MKVKFKLNRESYLFTIKMRLLVCCLIVISLVKASLDRYVPSKNGLLFEDTTKNSDMSCYRPCKLNVKPKRCQFSFKIEPTIQDDGKLALSINGMTPGPSIHVCVNDIVVVEVLNKVPDQDLSIHWHGVEQKGTPFMDGVPMVTQCPVPFGATYKYAFIASSPGTFFYHADSVLHHSDGVYGQLVVNEPTPLDPHSTMYDYDRSVENTLLFGAKFPRLLTGDLEHTAQVRPETLVVNGDAAYKIFVIPGYAYKLRLINAIAIECPITMEIEDHVMTVITSDGHPTRPVNGEAVKLYPGERLDVIVRASQDAGGYWVSARGSGACEGLKASAMFLYSGFNYTNMLDKQENRESIKTETPVNGQMLESIHEVVDNKEVKTFFLGIDRKKPEEEENDFRYISDAFDKKPFFPSHLSLREKGVIQINGKSFLYPNAPLLLTPKEIKTDTLCTVGEEDKQMDVQCVHVLNSDEDELIELALVNEGFNSKDSYTFHMHGAGVRIVATGLNTIQEPLSKSFFEKLYESGKIERNRRNPVIKDTFTVPNKGYTIIQFRSKPGSWLLECKSCGLHSLPTAIVVNVPQSMPKAVLDSLPKCGNYRPPDVLLH